jgi:multidrug efflux system membrane fusion protein
VAGARSGLESAQANIEAARAGVTAAEEEIRRLTISAPFSGVLETDTAELGSLLQPGALCATVLQLDPITLVGFVSEMDVARVIEGAPATARTISGHEVAGEVSFVGRSADPATRTFRVDVRVPNPDLTLRDADRTARFAPVTLLRDTPTGIWLTDLPERADIIVIGQEYVTDGVPVEPVYQELGQ